MTLRSSQEPSMTEELAGANVLDDPARTIAQLLKASLRGDHRHKGQCGKVRAGDVPSDSRCRGSRSR